MSSRDSANAFAKGLKQEASSALGHSVLEPTTPSRGGNEKGTIGSGPHETGGRLLRLKEVFMRVLVAYGSKMGGTEGLAAMVATELEGNGFEADAAPARSIRRLDAYDAVILGGALYSLRWHKDARSFVKRHRKALATMPLWLFSSGPLDDSAIEKDIPPVGFVRKTAELLGARGHVTFGGRLPADAEGFPAKAMARDGAGDWRDPDQVRLWAKEVAEQLHALG